MLFVKLSISTLKGKHRTVINNRFWTSEITITTLLQRDLSSKETKEKNIHQELNLPYSADDFYQIALHNYIQNVTLGTFLTRNSLGSLAFACNECT